LDYLYKRQQSVIEDARVQIVLNYFVIVNPIEEHGIDNSCFELAGKLTFFTKSWHSQNVFQSKCL